MAARLAARILADAEHAALLGVDQRQVVWLRAPDHLRMHPRVLRPHTPPDRPAGPQNSGASMVWVQISVLGV